MHSTPTGVDRVEMAYARGLLDAVPDRLSFAAVHPIGNVYGRLPAAAVRRFLDGTQQRWATRDIIARLDLRKSAMRALWELRPKVRMIGSGEGRAVYLKASPNNLTDPALVASILRRERAALACLVHDLIPLKYPEYARANGAALHARRVETMVTQAAALLCNSQATLDALKPYVERAGRPIATAFAHLGIDPPALRPADRPADDRPYFVCIGTIEPRKNHLLLLHLWRRLAERHGTSAIPRLIVIGRRGWENEQIVDMLERCPSLVGCVEEKGGLADRTVQWLLAGSCGLLMPSFAEGYGMPVTEALALGVPVICSDLPALREAGGDVPDFLDPLDGPAWERAVWAFSRPGSQARAAQDLRRQSWIPSSWADHVAILLELLHRIGS
ncbi:glycosyltransferase family 4 protein [Sphingomonas nostoxanthinifaciens]|uniref:glycosyltransferase family 4 protein n=1 Tax=Sphingomonas nostoxanthinifaciens TaxID=2872652 RepID=UPI001CC20AE2|nr:glycosyltransferase family 1 protein [Sphingomonas nostoxanthinifaciens]